MNRHFKHLSNLCKIAEDVVGAGAAKIAAALVLNNKVISFGTNSYRTDPFQKRFGKNSLAIYCHAEIATIKNALKRIPVRDLSSCTLYISRVKKISQYSTHYDSWGMAAPCEGCQRAIATFNIRNVYFTTNETNTYNCL